MGENPITARVTGDVESMISLSPNSILHDISAENPMSPSVLFGLRGDEVASTQVLRSPAPECVPLALALGSS